MTMVKKNPDDIRSIQTGNIFALGSVVLEGVAPVTPVFAQFDRSAIIVDGAPDLFNALSWNYGLTPCRGRDDSLATIMDWVHDADPISVRLISGRGGAGKTRMAAEVIQRLRAEGWSAGFLPNEATSGRLLQGEGSKGLLLVVDYPEERRERNGPRGNVLPRD